MNTYIKLAISACIFTIFKAIEASLNGTFDVHGGYVLLAVLVIIAIGAGLQKLLEKI